MAITLNTAIPKLNAVRNFLQLEFETDAYRIVDPVKAVLVLNITGDLLTAEDIKLSWNGNEVTFLCDDPADTPLKFLPTAPGDFIDDYVDTVLLPVLKSHYLLTNDFIIERTAGTAVSAEITITAREFGSDFTLTCVETFTNLSVGSNKAGVDASYQENFIIFCDIFTEDSPGSGSYSKLTTLFQKPDEYSKVWFELSKYLNACLSYDFPGDATDFTQCASNIIQFYLRYAEKYGVPESVPLVEYTSGYMALKAGLNFTEFTTTTFSNYIVVNKKFLSWHPNNKKVQTDQPEWLYYYIFGAAVNELHLKVKIYYSDATDTTVTQLDKTVGIDPYQVWMFPVGHDQLNLDAVTPAKTITKYDVWLIDQSGNTISEVRTYKIDRTYENNLRYLIYPNSLGGYDTLKCIGQYSENLDLEKTFADRPLQPDYSISDKQNLIADITGNKSFVLSSGYIETQEMFDYLDELKLSKDCYLQIDGDWYAIIITNKSFKGNGDDDFEKYLQIEAYFAHTEKVFTPKL